MYTFRVYTLWNQNFEEGFSFSRRLPLYRADQEISPNSKLSLEEVVDDPFSSSFPTYYPRIELSKTKLTPRDSLEILCTPAGIPEDEFPIYFSASIVPKEGPDLGTYYPNLIQRKQSLVGKRKEQISIQELYPPQKGLLAWGSLQAGNLEDPIAFALSDSTTVRFPTVEEGRFQVEFPDFYGKQTVQVFQENAQPVSKISILEQFR